MSKVNPPVSITVMIELNFHIKRVKSTEIDMELKFGNILLARSSNLF